MATTVTRGSPVTVIVEQKPVPDEIKRGTFFERDVPVSHMFVHYRDQIGGYARPLNRKRLAKLVDEWDAQALGVLLLSMRADGRFAVIDGQHRMEAATVHGMRGMDAYVYIDLTLEDEARLYRKFGDYLRQSARDRYLAGLAEGQPEIVAINRMLAERGLRVSMSASELGGVAAVDALIGVATKYGPHDLRQTIHLLYDAWGVEPRAYNGNLIRGTAMFLARFEKDPKFNRRRLIERLQREGLDQVEQLEMHQRALQKGDVNSAWGKALLSIHDARLNQQYRLGLWVDKLYSEQSMARVQAAAMAGRKNRTSEENSAAAQKAWATRRARGPAAS